MTGLNPIAIRLRTEHLLGTAALEPVSLSASAILIVRQMRDPLPGRLLRDPYAIGVASDWENAARHQMDQFVRQAARPADGPVPPNAQAVLFRDRAEMLACFLTDLARSAAWSRWWWQVLLRGLPMDLPAAVAETLQRETRYVPAVFDHLVRRGTSAEVIRLLSYFEAVAVAVEALAAAECAVARELTAVLRSDRKRAEHTAGAPPVQTASEPGQIRALPAPPAARAVTAEQRAVQEFGPYPRPRGVTKPHPPWAGAIASAEITRDLDLQRAAVTGLVVMLHRAPMEVSRTRFVERFAEWLRSEQAYREYAVPATKWPAAESANEIGRASRPALEPDAPAERTARAERMVEAPRPPAPDKSGATAAKSRDTRRNRGREIQTLHASTPPADFPATAVLPQFHEGVATQLGGVFFLINSFRLLGWPSVLAADIAGEPLSGWALLEIVARELAGPDYIEDALWPALAELDGRAPGEFAEAAQVREALLQQLVSRVRADLDLEETASVREALLLRTAEVQITSSHVDVVMSLEQVTLPVRIAGLDADPGWVPWLARVVAFHFR